MHCNLPPVCQHLPTSSSAAKQQPRTYKHSCLFPEPCYVIPTQTRWGLGRDVKIFSTQLLSPDSLGHTFVAYMPSDSWPLHRHTCTNHLVPLRYAFSQFLTHTHTHTAPLTDESQSSAACHVGWKVLSEQRSAAFIFSVSDLRMTLIHITCMKGAAWKCWITGVMSWQQKRKKSMFWASETKKRKKRFRWGYNIAIVILLNDA